MMKKLYALLALVSAFFAVQSPAMAQSTTGATQDYSTLTSAVDFSAASQALLAVAAVLVGVLVLRRAIRFVMGAIKG